MATRPLHLLAFALACGAAGLSVDALVMHHAQRSLPALSEARLDVDRAPVAPPFDATAFIPATATAPAAARDNFLRALMQPGPTTAVTIQRVDLPVSPSASPASASIALTLEGDYRAVKGRLLDGTAPAHDLRLQEFTLTRGPEGSGRVVADVVLAAPVTSAPATAGTP